MMSSRKTTADKSVSNHNNGDIGQNNHTQVGRKRRNKDSDEQTSCVDMLPILATCRHSIPRRDVSAVRCTSSKTCSKRRSVRKEGRCAYNTSCTLTLLKQSRQNPVINGGARGIRTPPWRFTQKQCPVNIVRILNLQAGRPASAVTRQYVRKFICHN